MYSAIKKKNSADKLLHNTVDIASAVLFLIQIIDYK